MSNHDRVPPLPSYDLHRHTPKAPECATYRPVATYDQMLAFLMNIQKVLETPSLENMTYILANQEPLHDIRIFLPRISKAVKLAALACKEAQIRSEEVARRFQQAWDLVDVKTNDVAKQTRYISTISQEMGETWRSHTSPPNKHWRVICTSLAFELKEAVENRHETRWQLQDAKRRAEKWEARYIQADEKRRNTSRDAWKLQEAFTGIRSEFVTTQLLAGRFMRKVQEDSRWIENDSERERMLRINRALRREEEREIAEYGGAISGF